MSNLWEKTAEDEITVKMNHSQFALWLSFVGKIRPADKELFWGNYSQWTSAMNYMEENTTFHNHQIVVEYDIRNLSSNAAKVTLKNS